MSQTNYNISLSGVANPTNELVMYSVSDSNASLQPFSPLIPVSRTTEPVITYPVHGSTPYVYNVANKSKKLTIIELISKAQDSLDIKGPKGEYTISFQPNGICIYSAFLSYGTMAGNVFSCTVTGSTLNIGVSTQLLPSMPHSAETSVEAPVYQISLTGVANPTNQLVMYSFSDSSAILQPSSPLIPVGPTTEPVITCHVEGSTPYVYTVANISNKLMITELISKAKASLDIKGPTGKYTITFKPTGIRIDSAVLSYGTRAGNVFSCTVAGSTLEIDVSNN